MYSKYWRFHSHIGLKFSYQIDLNKPMEQCPMEQCRMEQCNIFDQWLGVQEFYGTEVPTPTSDIKRKKTWWWWLQLARGAVGPQRLMWLRNPLFSLLVFPKMPFSFTVLCFSSCSSLRLCLQCEEPKFKASPELWVHIWQAHTVPHDGRYTDASRASALAGTSTCRCLTGVSQAPNWPLCCRTCQACDPAASHVRLARGRCSQAPCDWREITLQLDSTRAHEERFAFMKLCSLLVSEPPCWMPSR